MEADARGGGHRSSGAPVVGQRLQRPQREAECCLDLVSYLALSAGAPAAGQRRQWTRGKEVRVAGLQVPGGIRGARMGARVRNE